MATGCAQHVSQAFDAARDFYVPLSYGRLTLSRALPPRLLSHVRLREGSAGVLVFDVTLLDEHGDVLAEIERFTMRRVEGKGAFNAAAPATPQSRLFETVLKAGIEPEEGLEALERVLAARPGARVVACPVDLAAWDEELSRRPEPARDETVPARAREASRPFVAPRTELERRVAEVFRSLVGAEEIGAEDDFFELGGHSLLLIRAVTRLKQVLEVDLPLAAAFAAPSVAGIARAVESAREVGAAATPVVVPLTRSAFRVKRSELDPLSARR
jgi:acyl carrier protein